MSYQAAIGTFQRNADISIKPLFFGKALVEPFADDQCLPSVDQSTGCLI